MHIQTKKSQWIIKKTMKIFNLKIIYKYFKLLKLNKLFQILINKKNIKKAKNPFKFYQIYLF
jgi:hypothetical protein